MTGRNSGSAAVWTLVAVLAVSPAAAQDDAAALERELRAAELRVERQAAQSEAQAERIEVELREAEERLAEAAAQVAELSRQRLPDVAVFGRHLRNRDRPALGVTIGGGDEEGPVEGVTVRGVTPGSAAEEAGLRSGDVLTAVNDESLSADTQSDANRKLLEFMEGVEEGDTLEVEYLRDGQSDTVELEPRKREGFAFAFGDRSWHVPVAPAAPDLRWFRWHSAGGWGDMEMVPLTEELGRYFGTSEGLLVVRAPEDDSLKLEDGDVIRSIDGRAPTSVSHAMRILTSYQAGETLEIEIMRDKQRETLTIEMPDNRQGLLWRGFGGFVEAPVIVPAAPAGAPQVERLLPAAPPVEPLLPPARPPTRGDRI